MKNGGKEFMILYRLSYEIVMMSDSLYEECRIKLCGIPIELTLHFPDTQKYLKRYMVENDAPIGRISVCVTEQAFSDWKRAGNAIDGFAEFCLLCQPVSEALLDRDCCVFHAAALRIRDGAVLIAGGSGAGKSTHTRLLLEKHSDEFTVINGDKPILQDTENGVLVHPSPWNGKEGLHGAASAPLRGIFFIRRDTRNAVENCSEKEAGLLAFPMVFQSFGTEEVIRKAGAFAEKIVKSAPCFLFHSCDIAESSELLYRTINEVV